MPSIKMYKGGEIPLEFHKVRVVQRVKLLPIEERYKALLKAGFNPYMMDSEDVFIDMLTDSGTNAMTDTQLAAMMRADDAYSGSASHRRLTEAVREVLGKEYTQPAHQGRAAEHVIMRALVKEGDVVPMNYHFGSTVNHIRLRGGREVELVRDEAFNTQSSDLFKGNVDIDKLVKTIEEVGPEHIPFIRMEASTNLIGGQPFSMKNYKEVRAVADRYGLKILLDATLLAENAYMILVREPEYKNSSLAAILKEMASLSDILYFSARKFTSTRGGAICTNDRVLYRKLSAIVAVFEGYPSYGGMSMKEMEAMTVGLYEAREEDIICQSVQFIKYFVDEALKRGLPVVTPAGILGAHLDAERFLPHLDKRTDLLDCALTTAFYLVSGVRTNEGGTASEVTADDPDYLADLELVRLAFPRRVLTLSQTLYVLDRLEWLWDNKDLIGPMRFIEDPDGLPLTFRSACEPVGDWCQKLMAKYRQDFGEL